MHKYELLARSDDAAESGDTEGAQTSSPAWHRGGIRRNRIFGWSAHAIFFCISLVVLLSGLRIRSQALELCRDRDFLPMWSPVLEAVKDTGHFHRFDGSFATPNAYKGSPKPSIDEEWDRLLMADGGVISIDAETLQHINASQEYSVELSPEMGGGYMASVEVLHQLHCLNMLRQATYEDYYKDKAEPWRDSPQVLRYHLDHCIDNLRQKLMCEADTGVLTYVWAKGHPAPFPDFNVQHKCRNFDSIIDWVKQRQIFSKGGSRIERQPGAQELESPP